MVFVHCLFCFAFYVKEKPKIGTFGTAGSRNKQKEYISVSLSLSCVFLFVLASFSSKYVPNDTKERRPLMVSQPVPLSNSEGKSPFLCSIHGPISRKALMGFAWITCHPWSCHNGLGLGELWMVSLGYTSSFGGGDTSISPKTTEGRVTSQRWGEEGTTEQEKAAAFLPKTNWMFLLSLLQTRIH